jgi:hypothetical protein
MSGEGEGPTDYALRRRLALTRCQLVHNLGPEYVAGCCLCQRWADVFRDEPAEPGPPDVAEHGPDWTDSLPGEPPSCRCGYNGTPEECASAPPTPPLPDFECCASGRCEVCSPGYVW